MKIIPEKSENRRKFLKNGLRAFILGVIVFVSGFLGWREMSSGGDKNVCAVETPCNKCSQYPDCKIQKAVELKQNLSSNQKEIIW